MCRYLRLFQIILYVYMYKSIFSLQNYYGPTTYILILIRFTTSMSLVEFANCHGNSIILKKALFDQVSVNHFISYLNILNQRTQAEVLPHYYVALSFRGFNKKMIQFEFYFYQCTRHLRFIETFFNMYPHKLNCKCGTCSGYVICDRSYNKNQLISFWLRLKKAHGHKSSGVFFK